LKDVVVNEFVIGTLEVRGEEEMAMKVV